MTATCNRRWVAIAMLSLMSATSHFAVAATSEADRETARTLMDQADAQFEAKKYAEALKLYQAAHDLVGVPTTGIEVAKTQKALGQLVEARDTALSVSRIAVQPREPKVFAEARREARALADELESRIGAIVIKVSGVADEATLSVSIDGASIPATAALLPRKVNPGKHRVVVSAAGYRTVKSETEVPEGKTTEVTAILQLEASSGAAPVAAGGGDPSKHATPTAGSPASTVARTPEKSRGVPPLAYVGFGVGAAGVVVGAVTGVLTFSKKSSIQGTYCSGGSGCDPAAQRQLDQAQILANISNVGFGVGLVGIGVGVIALLTAPSRERPSLKTATSSKWRCGRENSLELQPVVTTNTLGIAGRF